ncbi:hypothetical protein [Caballeronia sp. dw_19]|uniref:hypothetical protein n=1 Tax=Caballeronia sp. dw_19 TaxID=2719791 RepID=UPI001BD221A7|nr:hypothetical protein [Caballeronia sp. dw_19]
MPTPSTSISGSFERRLTIRMVSPARARRSSSSKRIGKGHCTVLERQFRRILISALRPITTGACFLCPAHLCLFASDKSLIGLTSSSRRRIEGKNISEELLQRAVDASPDLLPYREFFPASRQIISLGMEVPLAFPGGRAGSIDNLLLTDDGHLIVVEMKLWRNPEAIREVVGQVFQYGLTLGNMGLAEIEGALTRCGRASSRLSPGQSLHEYAVDKFRIEDEQAFSKALEKFLRNGELLYLIAGDGIHVSVDAIALWINSRSGTPFHFGLLELDSYTTDRDERLIVPRLRVRTREISRHVIEVVVGGPKAELVEVQIEEKIHQPTGGVREDRRIIKSEKPLLSIEALEAQIRDANANSPDAVDVGLQLLRGLQDSGFDSRPILTEISFGIRDDTRPSKFISLINMAGPYVHLQVPNKKEDSATMRAFRERANQIFEFFDPAAIDDINKYSRQPKYRDLVGVGNALLTFLIQERDRILQQMQEQE